MDREGVANSYLGLVCVILAYFVLSCLAYNSLGDFKNAIAFFQRAVSIAKEVGRKDEEGSAYFNLGCVLWLSW